MRTIANLSATYMAMDRHELSFDTAEIEFEREISGSYSTYSTTEKIQPCEFTISLYAVF